MKVLDLGGGDGTTAAPLARLGSVPATFLRVTTRI